jgi:hypothetical protein
MKTGANEIFNALLFALPQGILLAVIWVVYSLWMTLSMRRFVKAWSPRRFTTFASTPRVRPATMEFSRAAFGDASLARKHN